MTSTSSSTPADTGTARKGWLSHATAWLGLVTAVLTLIIAVLGLATARAERERSAAQETADSLRQGFDAAQERLEQAGLPPVPDPAAEATADDARSFRRGTVTLTDNSCIRLTSTEPDWEVSRSSVCTLTDGITYHDGSLADSFSDVELGRVKSGAPDAFATCRAHTAWSDRLANLERGTTACARTSSGYLALLRVDSDVRTAPDAEITLSIVVWRP